jgi:hypothetical protein
MFKSKSRGIGKKSANKLSGWDAVIAEAKQRIEDLQYSVVIFERKKAANEPFPPVPQSDSDQI